VIFKILIFYLKIVIQQTVTVGHLVTMTTLQPFFYIYI